MSKMIEIKGDVDTWQQVKTVDRNAIIEECARVADRYGCGPAVIEAIRALKDKQ